MNLCWQEQTEPSLSQPVTTVPNCGISCHDNTQSVDSEDEKTVFSRKFCLRSDVMTKRLG